MRLLRTAWPVWIVVVAATCGCARHATGCRSSTSNADAEYGLPIVERTPIVGTIDSIDLPERAGDREYRGITALEAQCLAARASAIGNLLDQERAACDHPDCGPHCGCEGSVQLTVLRHAGAEARNKSAADALKLYYGLAETEAGVDAVNASLKLVDEVQDQIADVRNQDLKVPFDASQWERQRASLVAKRADLEATRTTLNAKLRALLGFSAEPDAPTFYPTDELRLTHAALDREFEVGYGLQAKPELAALRSLLAADRESTAAAAKALLGDVHGLTGLASRTMLEKMLNGLLGVSGKDADVRRSQIRSFYERRAEQLAGDIRAAVDIVELRERQAVAAQEQVESRRRRIEELRQRHQTGQASFVEQAEAQLRLTEEQTAVTSAVIAWKRAIVDLRELQGALVAQCCGGFTPTEVAVGEPAPTVVEPLPAPIDEADARDGRQQTEDDLEAVAAEVGILELPTYPTTSAPRDE